MSKWIVRLVSLAAFVAMAISVLPVQAADFTISLDPDTYIRGEPGESYKLQQANIPDYLQGHSVRVRAVAENNSSVHPGNNLIVRSGGGTVMLLDVEREAGAITEATGQLTLEGEVEIWLVLGSQSFSGGMIVEFDNPEPTPTATLQPTNTPVPSPSDTPTPSENPEAFGAVSCDGWSGHVRSGSDPITYEFAVWLDGILVGEPKRGSLEANKEIHLGGPLSLSGVHDVVIGYTLVVDNNPVGGVQRFKLDCQVETPTPPPPTSESCVPDGLAPVYITVLYDGEPIEGQRVALDVVGGGHYEGETLHETGIAQINLPQADWGKESSVSYLRDNRGNPVVFQVVAVVWDPGWLMGLSDCGGAFATIHLGNPAKLVMATKYCPTCPEAQCLLAEGNFVNLGEHGFAGIRNNLLVNYSSAADARAVGLVYAGTECSVCLLPWGSPGTIYYGPRSTVWDTAMKLAQLDGVDSMTQDQLDQFQAQARSIRQAWNDADNPVDDPDTEANEGFYFNLADLDN